MARVKPDADGWIVYAPPVEQQQTAWLAGALEAAVYDCRLFGRLARESKLEGLPQRLNLTWDEFCAQQLHQPAEVVAAILAGLEVIGEEVPVPQEEAERVGRVVLAQQQIASAQKLKQGRRTDIQPVANSYKLPKGSTSTARLAARLKAHHPAITARIEAGEFKSIHAAAIAAGLIKVKTPLDQLRHWWRKADAVAQQTFRLEIGKDGAA